MPRAGHMPALWALPGGGIFVPAVHLDAAAEQNGGKVL
jgi:hypothetical protein